MKFLLFGRPWIVGYYPMWRFEISDHEYWRRYCVGCVYALKFWRVEKLEGSDV